MTPVSLSTSKRAPQQSVFVRLGLVMTALSLIAGCGSDPSVKKQELFESGNHYFRQQQYRHAIIEYRNAVAIDATFGKARAQLAESYVRAGEAANGLQEYVRAADLLTHDFDVQLKAATLSLAAGRFDQALNRAEAALKLQPSSVAAHILRGNALSGLNSFDKALEAIEEAIRIDPKRGPTFTQKGVIEYARGQRDAAEAAFKKAIELAPTTTDGYLALGSYYWAVGRRQETEAAFQTALRIAPNDLTANRAMAALTLTMGRTAEAEQYLRRIADTAGEPVAVFALSDYYMLTGRYREAIARLQRLEAAGRNVSGVRQRLARAYAVSGDRPKAKAIVDEVLSKNPGDVEAQLLKGQLLLDEGKREEALAAIRSAVDGHPASAEAQFALGKLYSARGDNAAAKAGFREVLSLNPNVAAAQVELALLELSGGDAQASVRAAEGAVQAEPANAVARLMLVRSLLASGDLERAGREIAVLRTAYPQAAEVHVQGAVLAMSKNDVAGARAGFERALVLDPNSVEAFAGLAMIDLKAQDFAAAKARVDQRIAGPTPRAEWLLLAARTYIAADDPAGAERYLRRAIEIEPTLLAAYGMLGQMYLGQKKLDQARQEFEALAARQAKPVAALTMSGMILQSQGNLALAKRRFEDVLALDPRAAIAANNLAWIYADSDGNLDAALQLAQTAIAGTSNAPETMDTLGWVYYKKQLPQLALPLFSRSAQSVPGNPTYHYHAGLAFLQAGEIEKGKAAFQQALAAGPDESTATEIRRLLAGGRPSPAARR